LVNSPKEIVTGKATGINLRKIGGVTGHVKAAFGGIMCNTQPAIDRAPKLINMPGCSNSNSYLS
jgi:hypothetical protein